jgi:hypothetical protein
MYETRIDRHHEARIARRLAEAWRCELLPWGTCSLIDLVGVRDGRAVSIVEIKRRPGVSIDTFSSLICPAEKWRALVAAEKMLAVPVLFAQELAGNELWWCRPALCEGVEFSPVARHDRPNEPARQHAHIPSKCFRRVREDGQGTGVGGLCSLGPERL